MCVRSDWIEFVNALSGTWYISAKSRNLNKRVSSVHHGMRCILNTSPDRVYWSLQVTSNEVGAASANLI